MRRLDRYVMVLTVLFLAAALVLSLGTAYARYMEQVNGDQGFVARPLETPQLSQQSWQQVDDAYVLSFSMGETAQTYRIFLAVSEGVTQPEQLEVTLSLPGEEENTITLQAVPEQIQDASALHALFGTGFAYRFLDAETAEELLFELSNETYTLTVKGLDGAAEYASLVRLFVEKAGN